MMPIVLFLAAVFGVTWTLLWLLSPAAAQGPGVGTILAWLLPTVWTPTIAALLLTRWQHGAGAVRREIGARLRYRPGSAPWLIVAAVVPPLAIAAAVFMARGSGDAAPFTPSAAIPVMVLVQLLTGAVGEELGWRGFLLPRLASRLGETTAAWAMAILWSLWHVAGYLFPGMPHQTFPLVTSLLFVVFFGVFLAFLFNRTGMSIVATILAHLSLNVALGLGGVQLSSVVFWQTLTGIFAAVALLTTIALRTRFVAASMEARAAEAR